METKQQDSIIMLENRNSLKVTGVEKFYYSTQTETMLLTSYGKMHITGSNLNIKKVALEQNIVELEGKINTIKYTTSEKTNSKGLFNFFKRG